VTKANTLNQGDLRRLAVDLLSRREYSAKTLQQKLSERSDSFEDVQNVISYMQELGYQSDERFTRVFFNSRIIKKLGPYRIQRELKEKGIDKHLINTQLDEAEIDWFELAVNSGAYKSKQLDLNDFSARQKLYRYLVYRGFSQDHVQYALDQLKNLQNDA